MNNEERENKAMVEQHKQMQTIRQVMVTHHISFDRLALVSGVEPARIHLLLLGNYIRRRHAERVLQALSILSGKQWTCENVDGIRIYREHSMPFVLPYTMFVERKKPLRGK